MPTELAPPSPGGALVTAVLCRTEPEGPAVSHPVTIDADWSVTTGHDLEAERVAVAFGGHNSCLDLVDRVVPAVAAAAQRWTRTAPAPIAPTPSGRWHITEPCTCPDRGDSYGRAELAATHTRSIDHLPRLLGVPPSALVGLLRPVSDAYGDLTRPPRYDDRLITGASAAARLWAAGVSPGRVEAFHAATAASGPMTAGSYLLGVHGGDASEYLRSVLRVSDAADTVEWSLRTRQVFDHLSPRERAGWLALGASREDAVALMRASYPVAAARSLASVLDISALHATGALAAWARSGLAPSVADLAELHARRGHAWYAPTPQAVAPLRRQLRAQGVEVSPTRVGLVLVACGGSPSRALRILRSGVRG